ncbi:hypothetical protein ACVILJ_001889 [Bradyrhizobium diazoefficiens]|jgi:hypothetical protein|nr:hypothetical protein BD122_17405 [Bradyrhizobium diazoefficiens]
MRLANGGGRSSNNCESVTKYRESFHLQLRSTSRAHLLGAYPREAMSGLGDETRQLLVRTQEAARSHVSEIRRFNRGVALIEAQDEREPKR